MEDTNVLEREIGLDTGIYDFISRNSSSELRKKAVKSKSKVKCDSNVLRELAENKDSEALEEKVSGLLKQDSKQGFVTLLRDYHRIAHAYQFSAEQITTIAEAVIKHDLMDYAEYEKSDYRDAYTTPLRGSIQGSFVSDLLKVCKDKRLIKRLAKALSRDGMARDDNLIVRMYEHIGDDNSIAECATRVSLNNAINIFDKIKDPKLRQKTIRKAIPRTKNKASFYFSSALTTHNPHGNFLEYALERGFEKEIERFIDLTGKDGVAYADERLQNVVKGYKILKEHFASKKDKTRIDRKLEAIALDCIQTGNFRKFERVLNSFSQSKRFEKEVLKQTDKLFKRHLKEGYVKLKSGQITGFRDIDHFYFNAGYGYDKCDRRAGDICFGMGKYDLAIAFYRQTKHSEQLLFDTAIEIAKKGDTAKAFNIFEETDLVEVDTDKREFYKIIGSSILSLFINGADLNPSEIKKIYNDRIKYGLIEGISVSGKDDDLEIKINFGKHKLRYSKHKVKENSRNAVDVFEQSGLYDGNSVLKFYQDKKNAKAEAFWLGFFEGKIPIKRLVSSEKFGDLYFNQIEKSNGKNMRGAGYNTLKKAIDIAFDIYEHAKKSGKTDEISMRFVKERVKPFRHDAKKIYDTLSKEAEGIINYDYAPRNLMIEKGKIVVVDHESYMRGNPVAMAVTLVKNPENKITKKQADKLIAYARKKHNCSDEYVKAVNILWDCRQARGLEQGSKEREWYLRDMMEVKK